MGRTDRQREQRLDEHGAGELRALRFRSRAHGAERLKQAEGEGQGEIVEGAARGELGGRQGGTVDHGAFQLLGFATVVAVVNAASMRPPPAG